MRGGDFREYEYYVVVEKGQDMIRDYNSEENRHICIIENDVDLKNSAISVLGCQFTLSHHSFLEREKRREEREGKEI